MSSTILSNRYRVLSVLGDGGFGKTFLVEDTQMPSNRQCVLKQLKPIHDQTPEIRQLVQDRFQREAAILEKLGETHAQIPCLYAYFSENEQFYLVQEWIDGVTVAQQVEQAGPQSETLVKAMVASLLDAIAFIHSQGIVHRDIKPDNIILRRQDNQPVLIDFGAVKETMNTVLDSQNYSTRSIVVGTPGYMPVEQLSGRPVYASDLYSLGMTALYMLIGKSPQELVSDPATGQLLWRQHAPDISTDFADFLDTAIRTHTPDRFTSATAMQSALAQLSSSLPTELFTGIAAGPEAQISPPQTSSRRISSSQATSTQPNRTQASTPPEPIISPEQTVANPEQTVDAAHLRKPTTNRPTSSNRQSSALSDTSASSVSASGSSKNAFIIGGLLGASVLLGALVIVAYLPRPTTVTTEISPTDTNLPSALPAENTPATPSTDESLALEPENIPAPIPAPVVTPSSPQPVWEFVGTASSGESVSVNVSSLSLVGDLVDFEYQIGDERIQASADCFENRWYAEGYGWYSPQSTATQSMLNVVCQ